MKYNVTYTFGACITVDAKSEDDAIEQVEEMETDELLQSASDSFEIQSAEKA